MSARSASTRDPYARLVSGALFPLHERLKGHDTVARRRALEHSQWLDVESLERLQAQRLRGFLVQIGRRVPYYRALFARCGFDPERVQGPVDLQRLPLLDKPIIREQGEALMAEGTHGLKPFNTGGSSGEPLTFYLSRERVSHDVAAKWRATRWWGVDIGDPEIVLWGSPIELGGQDRIKALRDRLFRTRLLPAFSMGDEQMDAYLKTIADRRPRMLFGYPSALSLLAERREKLGAPKVARDDRVIFCTGERLYPAQREQLERVFGGRVANGYGSRDAGFIAHECPKGGMHISAEDIIVEIADEAGTPVAPGESGEIVVTHLATGEFPFVRYRTGDIAALSPTPCPCGRGLPCLTNIEGRTTDFIVAADGTRMHGLALIYVLREQPGIAHFRIEQESRLRTRVQVVPGDEWREDVKTAVRRGLQQRLGEAVSIEIDVVERIPQERSGKYRYVVSRVSE
ncbi:MAG: phenylacetate--CoA ligase family protein [Spiribacter salinus]|uniref:Phenylacetate--CoA ligase family protein n=1 Tax=Spiribacter salinus TaxID=1335746 RepID=A0A540VS95_9GAMM|nr:MAG: phenylacetate--CoA ligase family protein [Spiribacter salinus]